MALSPVLESCYTLVQKMELLTGVGGWPTSAHVDASTTMSAALGQVGSGQGNNGFCIAGFVGA